MAEFWVLHNYGSEGWSIVSKHEDILAAVLARESDVSNGGGESRIVEAVDTIDAYRRADYERDMQRRKAVAP